jgi:flagellar assembly factor FliW
MSENNTKGFEEGTKGFEEGSAMAMKNLEDLLTKLSQQKESKS